MLLKNWIQAGVFLGAIFLPAGWLMGQLPGLDLFGYHSGDTVPVDPAINKGKLENGLTYYIRENRKSFSLFSQKNSQQDFRLRI